MTVVNIGNCPKDYTLFPPLPTPPPLLINITNVNISFFGIDLYVHPGKMRNIFKEKQQQDFHDTIPLVKATNLIEFMHMVISLPPYSKTEW